MSAERECAVSGDRFYFTGIISPETCCFVSVCSRSNLGCSSCTLYVGWAFSIISIWIKLHNVSSVLWRNPVMPLVCLRGFIPSEIINQRGLLWIDQEMNPNPISELPLSYHKRELLTWKSNKKYVLRKRNYRIAIVCQHFTYIDYIRESFSMFSLKLWLLLRKGSRDL